MGFYVEKGLGEHVQPLLTVSRVYTLAEILSKIFVKKRREIGDLIYDHGLTNYRLGAYLFSIKVYYAILHLYIR